MHIYTCTMRKGETERETDTGRDREGKSGERERMGEREGGKEGEVKLLNARALA